MTASAAFVRSTAAFRLRCCSVSEFRLPRAIIEHRRLHEAASSSAAARIKRRVEEIPRPYFSIAIARLPLEADLALENLIFLGSDSGALCRER